MSYDIQLYTVQTQQRFQQANDLDFFEHSDNLVAFTAQQFEELKQRLLSYDYEIVQTEDQDIHFRKADTDSTALCYLTQNAVYFSSGWNDEDIFDISMTASEFTDSGEFAKFDPQSGEWESSTDWET